MSLIDENPARAIAATLFEKAIAPLAEARRAAGQQAYFPLAPESAVGSYFDEPALRVMQQADFEFPGGGTAEGLIDALAAAWSAAGESELAAMAPALKAIAEALRKEAVEGDRSVSILCYTMF